MARLDDAGGGNSGRSGTAASFSSGHVAEVLATPPVARKQDPREKLWFRYLASGMEEGEYASLPSAVTHGTATVTPSEKKCSQENTAFLDGMPMLPQ